MGPWLRPTHQDHPPCPPRPAPSWQSPTGGGQRPPTLSQAPEQLRPDHSLDGHHAYKPVLTALTNVCLESFFFFFSNREGQPARICQFKNVLMGPSPAAPRREPQMRAGPRRGGSTNTGSPPGPPDGTQQPPPPGPRAPGGAPTAKPHQPHRPQDHGVGRRLAEGQRALCLSHGTWPPHWALTRVLSRGLGGPLPHVHGDHAACGSF